MKKRNQQKLRIQLWKVGRLIVGGGVGVDWLLDTAELVKQEGISVRGIQFPDSFNTAQPSQLKVIEALPYLTTSKSHQGGLLANYHPRGRPLPAQAPRAPHDLLL